jgi:hypothetical protein
VGSTMSDPAVVSFLDGPGANQLTIAPVGTSFRLLYRGTPGVTCQLQRSLDLAAWNIILEKAVPAHGLVEYVETNAPASGAYYRVWQR